ncbi:UNVERIFIED_CONTAM: Retrovirus-related Pol polyprotein from transposon RE2 [Sesamum radiatum]|uniref:Retrovirus-related Pol polyprotein from transposon RE2 n=1 Tax=Sesamum radiatum TaxID=300843 RepID=A0AAW2L932_SESRA
MHSVPLPIVSPTSDTELPPPSSSIHPSPITDIVPASSSSSLPSLHSSPSSVPPVNIPLRHSTRISHKPAWLSDFICSHASDFSPAHIQFAAQLSILQEPTSYAQARGHLEWEQAMDEELQALENNQTWTLTALPNGKKAIGSRWVYKLKMNPDGTVNRYKARLVAKGYSQIEGIDYNDSFSPVAKTVTVRLFLGIAAAHFWPVHQLDINNAFLHGFLDEEVYMTPPDGYSAPPGQVCKLQRSLYGLKQASRQWNREFTLKLAEFGFKQSAHDHCLFIKPAPQGFVALLVYVDDILVMAPTRDLISEIKQYLDALFTIKDLGYAKYFLGLEIARSTEGAPDTGLFFPASNSLHLSAYTDADWGACVDSRRSVTGIVYFLVLRSSPGNPRNRTLFRVLRPKPSIELWLPLYAALHITANPVFHERTKHLDIDCHVVRDQYKAGFISPSFVSSKLQLADLFTKTLPAISFTSLLSKLGLLRLHPASA